MTLEELEHEVVETARDIAVLARQSQEILDGVNRLAEEVILLRREVGRIVQMVRALTNWRNTN